MSYTETSDFAQCAIVACSEYADILTRQVDACGCQQTVVNCLNGHLTIISIIMPQCRPARSFDGPDSRSEADEQG